MAAAAQTQDFAAFVAGNGRRLVHLAELLTGDGEQAQDLVQDVLARTYARWHRLEREDPYAYVRRGLVNARTDRWRRRTPVPVEDAGADRSQPDHADAVADRVVVLAALGGLTRRERGVVALRYYDDLTEAETARVLGVAVGTVKSTTARALGKLREHPGLRAALTEERR